METAKEGVKGKDKKGSSYAYTLALIQFQEFAS